MASPHSERFAITPSSDKGVTATPGSRVFQTPLRDEVMWRRLKEAGFDEESIKRRDKAALIAYIAKLEAEIYDHQYQMGLLILEKKELFSKCEQIKASAEGAELKYRREQSAHASVLAEARKREETLKKALGVEKECLTSIEKALHEMRAESAETKVAAESKLAEAHAMMKDAQKKFDEAEVKLRAAESIETAASRHRHFAERKIQEVEAREDDLKRRILSFNSECDAKENEMSLERKSLGERQRILHEGESRLTEGQAVLNQREDYILSRSQELIQAEKELEASKSELEKQRRALNDEKSNLDLRIASILAREEICIKKEALLNKKEQELLILQEKLANRESVETQKMVVSREAALKSRESEFEAELEMKRKIVESEIETKQRAWELRELDLRQQEDQLKDKEHDLDIQLRSLAEREKDILERSNDIDKREKLLGVAEQDFEHKVMQFEEEKEAFYRKKLDIKKSQDILEDEKKQIDGTKDELEVMKNEINELSVMKTKLKEELDRVRAEKLEILSEAEKMKEEKAKFEAEWELIDEKRAELKREAEHVAEERIAVSKFLKEERDSLRIEKDAMRIQYKNDAESLCAEREEFMNRIAHERSEWFSKCQQEHANILLEIEMQKKELENCIEKKHEELESSLREKEKAFEQRKKNELQHIKLLEEAAQKELEHVAAEMRRLEKERMEINLDRERRGKEWVELNNVIEELKLQREKLKEQRELLLADRKEIQDRIEQLKKLEDLNMVSEKMAVAAMQQSALESSMLKITRRATTRNDGDSDSKMHNRTGAFPMQEAINASPSSTPTSWFRRAADLIFTKSPLTHKDKSLIPENGNETLSQRSVLDSFEVDHGQGHERNKKTNGTFRKRQSEGLAISEEKMIFEVPTLDEDVVEIHTLESEIRQHASKKPSEVISDEPLQPGRKRRGSDLQSTDGVGALPELRQSKKKKHQLDKAAVNMSETSNSNCTNSGQSNAVGDVPASQSCNETQVVVEETTSFVIKEVTRISDVMQGEIVADACVVETDESILRGELNDHLGSTQTMKDVVNLETLHVHAEVGVVTHQSKHASSSDDPTLGN